jgi:GTPase SAR1 family protein
LLVYDISQRHSFEHVKQWYNRAKQLGGEELIAILVGNKIDLHSNRQVTTSEGETLAFELDIPFIETSALNGSNVEKAFVNMTRHIKQSIDKRGLKGIQSDALKSSGGVTLTQSEKKTTGGFCNCG